MLLKRTASYPVFKVYPMLQLALPRVIDQLESMYPWEYTGTFCRTREWRILVLMSALEGPILVKYSDVRWMPLESISGAENERFIVNKIRDIKGIVPLIMESNTPTAIIHGYPYIHGTDALTWTDQNIPFPSYTMKNIWPKVVFIMLRMAEIVCSIHARGVSHGDIKLENFLLSSSNEVWLTDFEFATTSKEGRAVGTLFYSAPEMIKGAEMIAKKLDVWALGVAFYGLVMGRLPFVDKTVKMITHKITVQKPLFLSATPLPIKRLIKSMLVRGPRKRANMSSVLRSIQEYAADYYTPKIPPPMCNKNSPEIQETEDETESFGIVNTLVNLAAQS